MWWKGQMCTPKGQLVHLKVQLKMEANLLVWGGNLGRQIWSGIDQRGFKKLIGNLY
jgi:hypothetical protein